MGWTEADIPDQSGRVAVITGANGGLGLWTARGLARAGAHVVMAVRNLEKADRARTWLLDKVPGASLEVVELDLASLASVRKAADGIVAAHAVIDILVNNAGLMAISEQQTADGFEMQFGTNHLGHFALTAHLLGSILRAPAARVVTVSSVAHHFGLPVNPRNPHLHGNYGPWRAYGQSKLANFHFGLGLDKRFRAAGVAAASLVAHPGYTRTDLYEVSATHGRGPTQRAARRIVESAGTSVRDGARPQLRAATDPAARGGEFWGPRFMMAGPPVRLPILRRWRMDRIIDSLWRVSERETGVVLDVGAVARSLNG
ncbi:MAG: oxidoreductase [Nitriliruptorales bacterium]|nr:oxidoreductase [Nitriliruptorales bacterium]